MPQMTNYTLTVVPTTLNKVITLNTMNTRLNGQVTVKFLPDYHSGTYYKNINFTNTVYMSRSSYSLSYSLGRYTFSGPSTFSFSFSPASELDFGKWYDTNYYLSFNGTNSNATDYGVYWYNAGASYTGTEGGGTDSIYLYSGYSVNSTVKGYDLYRDSTSLSKTVGATGTVSISYGSVTEKQDYHGQVWAYVKTRSVTLTIGGTTRDSTTLTSAGNYAPSSVSHSHPSDPTCSYYAKKSTEAFYVLNSADLNNNNIGIYGMSYYYGATGTVQLQTYSSSPSWYNTLGDVSTGTRFLLYPRTAGNWGYITSNSSGTCSSWILKWKQSAGTTCPYVYRIYASLSQ